MSVTGQPLYGQERGVQTRMFASEFPKRMLRTLKLHPSAMPVAHEVGTL